ncbi:ribosome small subunit-dependent GTPase A [Loktanella sp. IMCC34160]|uniref:ribosome small subunit-dependent GTPase A n=1 Tax=Loktanella sp. IMCC34160 TaxID=2510646 RepID=UPI00101C5D4A|nr:ribosome small subunit-dependent GTPase A [Loktanella sp. IMCC34160]RYG91561.1 ribosome small subunit-dependent GTPase A [Loktanella sp. IMCC34160]
MTRFSLSDLGWSAHFARQLDADETATPVRLTAVNRRDVEGLGPDGPVTLVTPMETGAYAVGDWVLSEGGRATALLDRSTMIQRRAAGHEVKGQLIAANVDTLGIVTSCNADFNPARLERYLAMAAAAGCLPLIVMTKADEAEDPADYVRRAEALSPLVTALAIDARDPEEVKRLVPWCKDGQTLALVGSSGVGKTTIQNCLTGIEDATQGIREDDAKGRHTTTSRALRPTLFGGWLIDTPGMRELRLTEAAEGIDAVFADIADLALECRFSDCKHETEPGCAIRAAIDAGSLDEARYERWQKLSREDQYNTETVAESRARYRKLNKLYKTGKARGDAKRR